MQEAPGKNIQTPCVPLIRQILKRFQVLPGRWKV